MRQTAKWRLLLLFVFLVQVLFFNSNLVYGIRLEIFWIVFVACAYKIPRHELPLIGVIFGWLNGIFLIDSSIELAVAGLLFGLVLVKLISLATWSLIWIRASVSVLLIGVFGLYFSYNSVFEPGFWWQFGIFIAIHSVVAILASAIIIDTEDE